MVTFEGPLVGGNGVFLVTATDPGAALAAAGYEQVEYTASGTATSYRARSGEPLPADGRYDLEPDGEAPFATRVVVRRPAGAGAFNGTVVVEWLNVSSGLDAGPDDTYLDAELLRGGYAWVGVSCQMIGVEGGGVAVQAPGAADMGAGTGLRALDPERYGDLHHPGDAYCYDIYTQVAQALRSPSGLDPLAGLAVERILAVGESQSAMTLTTYVNGVQPLAGAYDGFPVHSRGGAAAPLGTAGEGFEIGSVLFGEPTAIRTDGSAPVIVVITETDLLGVLRYLPARQPDADRFRLWEVAGTAHADKFQVGDMEEGLGLAQPINRGQLAFVLRAALRHLDAWAAGGPPAPTAARLDVDVDGSAPLPSFRVDDVGNATGGIRTPAVDVPLDVLTGLVPLDTSIIALLMGSTTPLDPEVLRKLYATPAEYLAAYEAAADRMIAAGFALPEDRPELLADAAPDRVPT